MTNTRCYLGRPVRPVLPPRVQHRWLTTEPGPPHSSPCLTVTRKRANPTNGTGDQPDLKTPTGRRRSRSKLSCSSCQRDRVDSDTGIRRRKQNERTRSRTETRLEDQLTVGFTSAAGNCCWRALNSQSNGSRAT